MSIASIVLATAVVGGTGFLIGIFLGFAGKKFAVWTDPREEKIIEALPGNNCGGCGFPGCSGLAAAIVQGDAPVNGCPVGGAPVAAVVAEIMGVEAGDAVHEVAFVACNGTKANAKDQYIYSGVSSCKMAAMMQGGGPKACKYGCLGFGDCVAVCQFDAIRIGEGGIAVVDKDQCKACKKCVQACPRGIISLVDYAGEHLVRCSSKDKGKAVIQACSVGCIGCKMCEKVCEFDAIHVTNNVAYKDLTKCTNCGKCVEKCPKHVMDLK